MTDEFRPKFPSTWPSGLFFLHRILGDGRTSAVRPYFRPQTSVIYVAGVSHEHIFRQSLFSKMLLTDLRPVSTDCNVCRTRRNDVGRPGMFRIRCCGRLPFRRSHVGGSLVVYGIRAVRYAGSTIFLGMDRSGSHPRCRTFGSPWMDAVAHFF